MKKKIVVSIILSITISLMLLINAFAGYELDYGVLEPAPPAKEANWTAWNQTWVNFFGQPPNEILTEDNTNCELGENLGYSNAFGDPEIVHWLIQVGNFTNPAPSPPYQYKIIFGGLGSTYSGYLWEKTFAWDNTTDQTNHGIVTDSYQGAACPIIEAQPVSGTERTVRFSGEPNAHYHVYRSQNASGHPTNTASNGRYFYLFSRTTNEFGLGEFTESDGYTGPNWYLVIQADPTTNAIIGCHSEEFGPTNVRVLDFTVNYVSAAGAVELAWTVGPEGETIGYNILRSTSEDGIKTQINPSLIPRKGGDGGNEYTYSDDNLELGVTYFYWLEVFGSSGRLELVGPREVQTEYVYYLPLIFK